MRNLLIPLLRTLECHCFSFRLQVNQSERSKSTIHFCSFVSLLPLIGWKWWREIFKSIVQLSEDNRTFICQLRQYKTLFSIASVEILDEIEVEYITLPGWMTSISDCRSFSGLPENAQAYIRKIEEITQIPGRCWLTSCSWLKRCSSKI